MTLLSADVFKATCHQTGRPPLTLQKSNTLLCGLGGSLLNTLGVCQIEIYKVGLIYVHVVEGIHEEMILGSDALGEGDAHIRYSDNMLSWHGKRFPLVPVANSGKQAAVKLQLGTGNDELNEILNEYEGIFSQKGRRLGQCNLLHAHIETGSSYPIKQ